jgi:hypothetical protein
MVELARERDLSAAAPAQRTGREHTNLRVQGSLCLARQRATGHDAVRPDPCTTTAGTHVSEDESHVDFSWGFVAVTVSSQHTSSAPLVGPHSAPVPTAVRSVQLEAKAASALLRAPGRLYQFVKLDAGAACAQASARARHVCAAAYSSRAQRCEYRSAAHGERSGKGG